MPYRNPNTARMAQQSTVMQTYAGETATWRQFVSAVSGNAAVGLGSAVYYRQQLITGVFGDGVATTNTFAQRPVGQLQAGQIRIVTTEKLAQDDEIVYRGDTYRVDSEPTYSVLNGRYIAILNRGK